MQAVIKSGFLAVPNANVLPNLKSVATAFCGGLFFTLSLGVGLTLATLALTWLLADRKGVGAPKGFILLFFWALSLVLINLDGFEINKSLYFLLIPPLVFVVSKRSIKSNTFRRHESFQLLPVIILAVLWFSQFDANMFIDIRDRLLLTNPIGEKLNEFYYRYTLYPAEVFKSLSQKTIRTTHFELASKARGRRMISKKLVGLDWLPISEHKLADLYIGGDDQRLVFYNKDRAQMTTTVAKLSSKPAEVLEAFSEKTDHNMLFRRVCFYGLLLGFPLLLYIGFYTVLRYLVALIISKRKAAIVVSVVCLTLGVAVWFYFQQGRSRVFSSDEIAQALSAKSWQTQVAALRLCKKENIDPRQFASYDKLAQSPHTAVRYWLVQALLVSKKKGTLQELIRFLDDPSVNVTTRACDILARRNQRIAIAPLLEHLKRSDQWYFQWYAYKALRALGWKQTPLK